MPSKSPAETFAKHAINESLEMLQRRWTLRIIWELSSCDVTFRALQQRCDEVSPSVLNQRLSELRSAGLVQHGESGYALTSQGRQLIEALTPFTKWAVRWRKSLVAKS